MFICHVKLPDKWNMNPSAKFGREFFSGTTVRLAVSN
jgi:hypothetical protein